LGKLLVAVGVQLDLRLRRDRRQFGPGQTDFEFDRGLGRIEADVAELKAQLAARQ